MRRVWCSGGALVLFVCCEVASGLVGGSTPPVDLLAGPGGETRASPLCPLTGARLNPLFRGPRACQGRCAPCRWATRPSNETQQHSHWPRPFTKPSRASPRSRPDMDPRPPACCPSALSSIPPFPANTTTLPARPRPGLMIGSQRVALDALDHANMAPWRSTSSGARPVAGGKPHVQNQGIYSIHHTDHLGNDACRLRDPTSHRRWKETRLGKPTCQGEPPVPLIRRCSVGLPLVADRLAPVQVYLTFPCAEREQEAAGRLDITKLDTPFCSLPLPFYFPCFTFYLHFFLCLAVVSGVSLHGPGCFGICRHYRFTHTVTSHPYHTV